MEDNSLHPPAVDRAAYPIAAAAQQHNNYHPLDYIVDCLPIEHIATFLPNVSVGFLALAIYRLCPSPSSPVSTFGSHVDAVAKLMMLGGMEYGSERWADINLLRWDGIDDVDVEELLSLVNKFWRYKFKYLTIQSCPGVDGTGLYPLLYSNALTRFCFHDNKRLALSPRKTGYSPIETMRTILSSIGGDGPDESLLEFVSLPYDWFRRNLRIMTCGGNCCQRGQQRMHWCHGCGKGPFCENGVGAVFVLCSETKEAYCLSCIRFVKKRFARRCPHGCGRWHCACLCDSPLCFECDRYVCLFCGDSNCVEENDNCCLRGCPANDEFCLRHHRGIGCS
mmetsp:Transcript_25305/g.42972  ORF Transcript_25305/g.42972 Transcript_25305/m.42972 type:complete len:336 (-) Transcript_25305:2573-3580(-)